MKSNTLIKTIKVLTLLGLLTFGGIGAFIYFQLIPKLPTMDDLKDIQLQVPLRVYTSDEKLIGEFGEKKRTPLHYSDTPTQMINAILAAEDDRFFEHPGVDYQGILRAVYTLATTGQKSQGGSTITMQVVRNFFLSREKTYLRKLNEILLSLKIERALSKEQILELYLNKIFLGHRAYGFGAAAQVYYGKPIDQLSLAQMAMLAGLPKAPSRYNPISNLERATLRRNYVLRRMKELNFITEAEYQEAVKQQDIAKLHTQPIEVEAPYIAEMVRSELYKQYGKNLYTEGMKVYTTLDSDKQQAANNALKQAIIEYDWRHGYRGPIGQIDLETETEQAAWDNTLSKIQVINEIYPALVTEVANKQVTVYSPKYGPIEITWDGLSWARSGEKGSNKLGPKPEQAGDILNAGDIIQITYTSKKKWYLTQTPEIEGALVSLSPTTGAIKALLGGFNFYKSKFNRAVQGKRQPGSNFKPFIYTAALDKGYTPASLINDAPVVFEDDALETMWRPENYSGKFFGPTRMREALIHSRNLVSIRLLRSIGINYAVNYSEKFGFDADNLPHDLSLALGSASASPLEIATGYAVLANGGYKVNPYFIERIEDKDNNILFQAYPAFACLDCQFDTTREATIEPGEHPLKVAEQVISPQTIHQIDSILEDVIKRGTGRRALRIGRKDLHGKTGTTNDQYDAWFSGFNTALVTTAWVGFDQPQPLGSRETGGRAALPMWIYYMEKALKGLPNINLPQPPGMITVRIDPETGKLAESGYPNAIFETFRAEYAPKEKAPTPETKGGAVISPQQPSADGEPEELF